MARDRRLAEDGGFTLIELLVVVIIIGVLSAIAIPAYLSQRESAYERTAAADARNMVSAQFAVFATTANFATTVADLEAGGFKGSREAEHAVCVVGGSRFLVGARHPEVATVYVFDTASSRLEAQTATDVEAALESLDPGCDAVTS